jgi:hypothetical protein
MNKKTKFMQAVKNLAPNDNFIINMAQSVREDVLPQYPGIYALELVAGLQRIKCLCPVITGLWRFNAGPQNEPVNLDEELPGSNLKLKDAMEIRSAEYWLKLGHWEEALDALEKLSDAAKSSSWALSVYSQARKMKGGRA